MTYAINGSTASIAPHTVRWVPSKVATAQNGAPIYSRYYTIEMQFDAASPLAAQQWLENALGASVNLTVLDRWSTGSTILSGVYIEVVDPAATVATYSDSFTLLVRKALPGTSGSASSGPAP